MRAASAAKNHIYPDLQEEFENDFFSDTSKFMLETRERVSELCMERKRLSFRERLDSKSLFELLFLFCDWLPKKKPECGSPANT